MSTKMPADMEMGTVGGKQAFKYSGVKIDKLGATEYTLVTIAVDVSGSVSGFRTELKKCLQIAVESLKRSPRSSNLLVRVGYFSTMSSQGVEEIHGFKLLKDVDPTQYPDPRCGGSTPLYIASYSAIGATNAYAKSLMDQDFLVNGIVFIVTDGGDTEGGITPQMIKKELERGVKNEEIESLIGICVGINAQGCAQYLSIMETQAGMSYIDAGDATPSKLAKLAGFISQSVSSQSQSLGTGGPSQNIAVTI
jgi:uncharacterized protein YegL